MVKKRKVSIADVAARAKVSISTVSRVLNRFPTVSKDNQARVEEAIAYLKYQPDISAQRLASGRNDAIGLVMPGYPGIFHSFYAIEIIRGIGHACETLRLDLVFHITNGMNPLNTKSVGGVIFADIIENRRQVMDSLYNDTPAMVINNIVNDLDVNYLGIDNVTGAQTATDYLANLGHKHIATITGNIKTQAGSHRLEGFQKSIKRQGIEARDEYVIEGDYSRRSARLATEKFLALERPPTAIFAASDDMALETIAVLLERGIKVPDDFSVIGFDDNPSSIYGPVALTTIRQPLFHMAEEAVKYLYNIMTGKRKAMVQKVLTPQLIIRDSCAAPAK